MLKEKESKIWPNVEEEGMSEERNVLKKKRRKKKRVLNEWMCKKKIKKRMSILPLVLER